MVSVNLEGVTSIPFIFSERDSKRYFNVFDDFSFGKMTDQQIYLKCVKNAIKNIEIIKIIKKCLVMILSKSRIYEWYKRSQKDGTVMRSGYPSKFLEKIKILYLII